MVPRPSPTARDRDRQDKAICGEGGRGPGDAQSELEEMDDAVAGDDGAPPPDA